MKIFILIIILNSGNGISVETAEFNSLATCQTAKEIMLKSPSMNNGSMKYAHKNFFCVEK